MRILSVLTGLLLLASGCAQGESALPGFDGPGRLLLILEDARGATLHVLDADGARSLPVESPREARWIDAGSLLVLREVPSQQEYGLPDTRLEIVDLASGDARPVGGAGRHYDAEPSPDGRWLAVGAEVAGVGDSDLEIWSLADRERVASRQQSLEEPRWRGDGRALVASVLMADPETDDDTGGAMLGTSFTWPRLHRLRRDLGDPTLLFDGDDPTSLAPGGSLPLWWDARGIFARQRRGLVRCDPMTGGCVAVYATDDARRVVDGRPVGERDAWLLTVEARDAFDRRLPDEILRVRIDGGAPLGRWRAPEGVGVTEIDWIGDPP